MDSSLSTKENAYWAIDQDSPFLRFIFRSEITSPMPVPTPTGSQAMRDFQVAPTKATTKASLKRSHGGSSIRSHAKRRATCQRKNDHYSPPNSPRLSPVGWQMTLPILSKSNSTKIGPKKDKIPLGKDTSRLSNIEEGRLSRPNSLPPIHRLSIRSNASQSSKSKIATDKKPQSAAVHKREKEKIKECYNCGVIGHSFMDCMIQCGHCGKNGHKTIWCTMAGRNLAAIDIDQK